MKKIYEFKFVLISAVVMVLSLLYIKMNSIQPNTDMLTYTCLTLYLLAILSFYFSLIYLISNAVPDLVVKDIFTTVLLYFALALVLILFFAFAWDVFKAYKCSPACLDTGFVNPFYFSAVAFTTIGFGDILPKNDVGKWLIITQALIGTTHSAVFVSVLFLKFKKA